MRAANGGRRRPLEMAALAVLTLGLWVVPAMVSQGQDRSAETLDSLHVDSGVVGHDRAARATLATADALAMTLVVPAG